MNDSDKVRSAFEGLAHFATATTEEGGAAAFPNGAAAAEDDADIPDLNEASVMVKNIKDMDEDERALMLRKRNAIYSKRKYYKKKKEVSRLESTKYELETENQRLKTEHRRLETLLLDAKRKIDVMKAVPPSPYAGLTSGLLHPFAGPALTPLGVGHSGLPMSASGFGSMDPIMQQAYLRNMILDSSQQQHQQVRQMEIQRAIVLQQERERLAFNGMFGTHLPSSTGMGGAARIPGMPHPQMMDLNLPPSLSNMARGLPSEEEAKFSTSPPPLLQQQQPMLPEDVHSNEGLLQYLLMQRSQQQFDGNNNS